MGRGAIGSQYYMHFLLSMNFCVACLVIISVQNGAGCIHHVVADLGGPGGSPHPIGHTLHFRLCTVDPSCI